MAKVEIKQPIVDEIKANVEGAASAVLVDYRGLTVAELKAIAEVQMPRERRRVLGARPINVTYELLRSSTKRQCEVDFLKIRKNRVEFAKRG